MPEGLVKMDEPENGDPGLQAQLDGNQLDLQAFPGVGHKEQADRR